MHSQKNGTKAVTRTRF